ncbi:phage tail protein [Azohydromonas lata]|uniref:Phage tail protein n=1 Tax=Azohydromonas lata TaxID=45677 RepID=A0ABU5IGB3_9BURK|nr:phage tail protein [Azohydromonas lata]MDZ5456993.1 phage tail protein [Azohydromonas lata]
MSTKPVFQLDAAGLFAGVTIADESPMEPDVWLLPAGTVDATPPAHWPPLVLALFATEEQLQSQALAELTEWPRYNGATWELVPRPRPADQVQAEPTAVEKLAAFLAANPDVADLVTRGG